MHYKRKNTHVHIKQHIHIPTSLASTHTHKQTRAHNIFLIRLYYRTARNKHVETNNHVCVIYLGKHSHTITYISLNTYWFYTFVNFRCNANKLRTWNKQMSLNQQEELNTIIRFVFLPTKWTCNSFCSLFFSAFLHTLNDKQPKTKEEKQKTGLQWKLNATKQLLMHKVHCCFARQTIEYLNNHRGSWEQKRNEKRNVVCYCGRDGGQA